MKKYLLLITIIALSILSTEVKAQHYNNTYREDSWHVNIGANGLYNLNPGKSFYGAGLGGQLGLEYYPSPFAGITLTTGYFDLFRNKNNKTENQDFTFVPAKVGIKGFLLNDWYVQGEFGFGYANPDVAKNKHFAKTIAPSIGWNANNGLDISLRYENVHHQNNYVSMIAFQVAYSIDLSPRY